MKERRKERKTQIRERNRQRHKHRKRGKKNILLKNREFTLTYLIAYNKWMK